MNPADIFLRGVWKLIPDDRDTAWVHRIAQQPASDEPLGDYGAVIRRMLDAGVPPADIARLARLAAYETAHGLLYHLEDPAVSYEGFPETDDQPLWSLTLIDEDTDQPTTPLRGLHESLLSLDPAGKEMRPAKP